MQRARIVVGWKWAQEDRAEIEQLFRSEGIEVETQELPSIGNDVGFLLPISVFDVALAAFITGFAGAAEADAWKNTKRVVGSAKRWFKSRYGADPPHDQVILVLFHPDSETRVDISSEMPDEAFRKLHELEADLVPGATYVWDEDRAEWTGRQKPPIPPEKTGVLDRLRRLFGTRSKS